MPKIRPIVGHKSILEEMNRDLETGNVTHAYLMSGPANLGKIAVAHWFAQKLLTHDLSAEEADDALENIERLTHPDLLTLDQLWIEGVCEDWDVIAKSSNVPQQHRAKKPSAKTDIISIDDIRAFQERLHETGTGTYRCCIIRSIDRMKDAAANAFLKILEEPPEGLVFLLTTESLSALLPTIVSRTRILRFHRLAHHEILPVLEGIPEEDAQFILHISQGAPGIAKNLADDPDLLREHRQDHSKAQKFWHAQSLKERLQITKPLHNRGKEADRFLLHLALTLRELKPEQDQTRALHHLARGLKTNAHRQLLTQQFALAV